MEFKEYSIEDFAKNSFFIRWIKHPDDDSDWFWQNFLKEHPSKQSDVQKAKSIVLALKFEADTLQPDEQLAMRTRLLMIIQSDREKQKDFIKNTGTDKSRKLFQYLKYAALIIVTVGSGYLLTLISKKDTNSILAHADVKTEESHQTLRGQKLALTLLDGTKVWLNSNSHLTYSTDFNEGEYREVFLDGEGLFDVAHNPEKPFIVRTSRLDIHVLGTSFNVKSYSDDATIETTLIRGKVSINKILDNGDGSLLLKPNQRAIFEKQTNTLNVEQVVAVNASLWRDNRLVFDETPLSEVIKQLERRFNTHFIIEDKSSLSCKLTADIDIESLEDVMSLLTLTHKIDYTITKDTVLIKGNFCH